MSVRDPDFVPIPAVSECGESVFVDAMPPGVTSTQDVTSRATAVARLRPDAARLSCSAMTVTIVEATTPEAIERLVAVRNRVDARFVTADGYRAEELGATGLRDVIAVQDGRDVGAGNVLWREWGVEHHTCGMHVWVLPDARGHGIGRSLVADLAAYARAAGMTTWLSNTDEGDARSRAFARRIGLEEGPAGAAGYLDLTADPPPGSDGNGSVTVASYAERPDLARAIYDLEVLVAPEVPALADDPPPSYEAWTSETADDPGFLRDLTLVALDGDRVVGSIMTYDVGDSTVYIGMTAVHPDARRRGIASGLKAALAERARVAGWRRLMTYNDGANDAIRFGSPLAVWHLQPEVPYGLHQALLEPGVGAPSLAAARDGRGDSHRRGT